MELLITEYICPGRRRWSRTLDHDERTDRFAAAVAGTEGDRGKCCPGGNTLEPGDFTYLERAVDRPALPRCRLGKAPSPPSPPTSVMHAGGAPTATSRSCSCTASAATASPAQRSTAPTATPR